MILIHVVTIRPSHSLRTLYSLVMNEHHCLLNLTHSVNHSFTRSRICSHSLTLTHMHSLSHALARNARSHSLTHSRTSVPSFNAHFARSCASLDLETNEQRRSAHRSRAGSPHALRATRRHVSMRSRADTRLPRRPLSEPHGWCPSQGRAGGQAVQVDCWSCGSGYLVRSLQSECNVWQGVLDALVVAVVIMRSSLHIRMSLCTWRRETV